MPTIRKRAPNGEPMRWLLEVALPYEGDDCLFWPFGTNGCGYGRVWQDGKDHYAHREVCRLRHGPPPTPEHEAAHSCGRGHEGCVNGGHIRWATRAENKADELLHGTRARQPGERNSQARLTVAQVRAIRADLRQQIDIAADYGVAQNTISDIRTGRTWSRP